MCFVEKHLANHLLVHCQWLSALGHLSLLLMGISWVQPRCFGGLKKKVKEEMDLRSLEGDAFGYLVVHVEGDALLDF